MKKIPRPSRPTLVYTHFLRSWVDKAKVGARYPWKSGAKIEKNSIPRLCIVKFNISISINNKWRIVLR